MRAQNAKIFSGKEIETNPVKPKKLGEPSVPKLNVPIRCPEITFKINRKFVMVPKEKRAEYIGILDKMIKRVVAAESI